MSIQDYQIVSVATVYGEENVIVFEDEEDYFLIDRYGDSQYVAPRDVTNIREAIVLPLPEVFEEQQWHPKAVYLHSHGWGWPADWTDDELENVALKGSAAAAVLRYRNAKRKAELREKQANELKAAIDAQLESDRMMNGCNAEPQESPMPNLTDDIKAVMRGITTPETDAAKRIIRALNEGATLVESDTKKINLTVDVRLLIECAAMNLSEVDHVLNDGKVIMFRNAMYRVLNAVNDGATLENRNPSVETIPWPTQS